MEEDEGIYCPTCTGHFSAAGEDVESVLGARGEFYLVCPSCGDLVDPDEAE